MVQKVALAKIHLPKKTLSDDQQKVISELADSIKEIGLSHPIILKKCSPTEQLYKIIAGERRVLAFKSLGIAEIDADIRDLTEVKGSIIRIHENLRRFNLPWPEQVALIEELHNLRQSEHGVALSGKPKKDEPKGWSIRDTASELKVGIGNLSEDLLLAKALESDPRLADVKDKKTALRLARIAVSREEAKEEARTVVHDRDFINHTFLGDSAEILKRFDADSVDHCITDPPWIRYFDAKLRLDDRTLPVFKELWRVLKAGGFLYVFSGLDDYHYYAGRNIPDQMEVKQFKHELGKLEHIGYTVSTTPIIWQKTKNLTRRGVRPWEYDRDFEFIAVATKGSGAILTSPTRCSGVKKCDIVPSPSAIHPNEKPLALIESIILDCSHEKQVILDPFAGSGVVGEACKRLKRPYVMIERDPTYYNAIVKRLKENK